MTTTTVRERGIPFTAPMVLALRREVGPKTQTRRLVSPQPPPEATHSHYREFVDALGHATGKGHWEFLNKRWHEAAKAFVGPELIMMLSCPYGGPGDLLRVNESHRFPDRYDDVAPVMVPDTAAVWYEADGPPPKGARRWGRLRPPRFMRKPFSRMKRYVVEVRAQRLQEISEEDARAEGAPSIFGFANSWDDIHGEGEWKKNPWVWAITFRRTPA